MLTKQRSLAQKQSGFIWWIGETLLSELFLCGKTSFACDGKYFGLIVNDSTDCAPIVIGSVTDTRRRPSHRIDTYSIHPKLCCIQFLLKVKIIKL